GSALQVEPSGQIDVVARDVGNGRQLRAERLMGHEIPVDERVAVDEQSAQNDEDDYARAELRDLEHGFSSLPWRRSGLASHRAVPLRARRVGTTQSNMSTPSAIAASISASVPSPMKYRGTSPGISDTLAAVISSITSTGSPSDSPPMATPSNPSAPMARADSRRSVASKPTCTMPHTKLPP